MDLDGSGTSLPGSLARRSSAWRIHETGAAAIVAHAPASHGQSSVSTIFKNPPISDRNTNGASSRLATTAHGLSWSKWKAMSGIDTTQATTPALMAAIVNRRTPGRQPLGPPA